MIQGKGIGHSTCLTTWALGHAERPGRVHRPPRVGAGDTAAVAVSTAGNASRVSTSTVG
jgi:hypothetical protein